MPPVGFEHTISAGERLQTYALDRAATGTGIEQNWFLKLPIKFLYFVEHYGEIIEAALFFLFILHCRYLHLYL